MQMTQISSEMIGQKDELRKVEKLLKRQIFIQTVQMVTTILIFLVIMCVCFGILYAARDIKKTIDEVQVAISEVEDKVNELEVGKINETFDKASASLDDMTAILGTMDEAVQKIDVLLENLRIASESMDELQEKADILAEMFGR